MTGQARRPPTPGRCSEKPLSQASWDRPAEYGVLLAPGCLVWLVFRAPPGRADLPPTRQYCEEERSGVVSDSRLAAEERSEGRGDTRLICGTLVGQRQGWAGRGRYRPIASTCNSEAEQGHCGTA